MLEVAVEAGREVTPLVAAVRPAAVRGLRMAPGPAEVLRYAGGMAPCGIDEARSVNERSLREGVAGARAGRGQCVMLLSPTLVAARPAGNREVRKLSRSTSDQRRREDMISSPASSNNTVERTGGLRYLSATGAQ